MIVLLKYRTTQTEQPGVQRTKVKERIEALPPLNFSDVAKAAYAMKAEDGSGSCTGEIDVYRTCGSFKLSFALPFVSLALFIVLVWLVAMIAIRNVPAAVPVDTVSWRKHALKAVKVKDSIIDEANGIGSPAHLNESLGKDFEVFHAHMIDPDVLEQRRVSNSRGLRFKF